ncbi:zinc finger, CCHC-type containing protein, partial [Tanacetum coccineum]
MTKITDLESELKGYREDVDDRFNAVEGRFNALEKDFNGKHAELLAAIQSLTNQVQGLTSQSPKPSKNKEQPKVTTTNLQFDDLGFPYPTFVSESSAAREKINIPEQDVRFQPVNREGMKFGTGSNGNGEYFRVQGNGLQPGMRSYGAEYRLRKLKMPIFKGEDAYGRLLDRFQQSQKGSLYEQFLAITQVGSAREYVALFEKLAGQLVGVPEIILEGTFIKGLKQDLRVVVRVLNPEGLSKILSNIAEKFGSDIYHRDLEPRFFLGPRSEISTRSRRDIAEINCPASSFAKLEKFKGVDFRRWQKKMHFMLSSMSMVYVLTTPTPDDGGENPTVEHVRKRAKWDNDDYVCRGLILNGMSDSLFDVYQNVEESKELWDTLEAKYMAEDASSKKFLVSNFTNYKMTDSRPVLEQYNELLGILRRFTQHNMNMDESIKVSCIIDKLPPSWKDFKHTLKHLKEELTLIELGSHLRIEESLRAQDSDKPKGNNVAGPSVVNMVEHNNSSRYNDNKGKRKHHDTRANPNKKTKVTCWKCGKPGHLKKDCKGGN